MVYEIIPIYTWVAFHPLYTPKQSGARFSIAPLNYQIIDIKHLLGSWLFISLQKIALKNHISKTAMVVGFINMDFTHSK